MTCRSRREFFVHPFVVAAIVCLTGGFCQAAADDAKAETKPVQAIPEKSKFHLYLLAGQSNMAGRGKLTEADRKPVDSVFMLNKEGQWVPAVDPLHFDKPAAGVGLGRTFAAEMLKSLPDDVSIGLIPAAAGGSAIDSWTPGGYHDQTKSHPWDDAVKRTRIALQAGTLNGILWHQGESDGNAKLSTTYEAKLHDLIGRFRREFQSPNLPVVVGQLGQFADNPPPDENRRRVMNVIQATPGKVPNTAFVDSDGLGHNGDKVHFNADAYRELGRRYAEALKKLVRAGG
ncbi:MAG: sialate O-acetylesterase [bacterium]